MLPQISESHRGNVRPGRDVLPPERHVFDEEPGCTGAIWDRLPSDERTKTDLIGVGLWVRLISGQWTLVVRKRRRGVATPVWIGEEQQMIHEKVREMTERPWPLGRTIWRFGVLHVGRGDETAVKSDGGFRFPVTNSLERLSSHFETTSPPTASQKPSATRDRRWNWSSHARGSSGLASPWSPVSSHLAS